MEPYQFTEDELVIFATNTADFDGYFINFGRNSNRSNSHSRNDSNISKKTDDSKLQMFIQHYKKMLESPTPEMEERLVNIKRNLSVLKEERKVISTINERLASLMEISNILKEAHDAIEMKSITPVNIENHHEQTFPLQDALEYIQPFYQYEYLSNIIFTSQSSGGCGGGGIALNAEASIALMKQISLYLSLLDGDVLKHSKDYETYKNRYLKLEEEHILLLVKENLYPSINNVAKSAINRLQSWERMIREEDGDYIVSPTSLMQQINSDYLQLASGPIGRVISSIVEHCRSSPSSAVFRGLIRDDFLLFRRDICKKILLPLNDDNIIYDLAQYVIGMEEDIFNRLLLRGRSSLIFKELFTKHLVTDLMSLFIRAIKDLPHLMENEDKQCRASGRSEWQAMFIIRCKDECLRKECLSSVRKSSLP